MQTWFYVVVVGGGVSGLVIVCFLRDGACIIFVEVAPRLGGKVLTQSIGGLFVDIGLDAVLTWIFVF